MPSHSPHKYWFKARRAGWGWTPDSWQGWAVLAAYVIVLISANGVIEPPNMQLKYFAVVLGLTFGFLGVCAWKGEPRR